MKQAAMTGQSPVLPFAGWFEEWLISPAVMVVRGVLVCTWQGSRLQVCFAKLK
jgi:hypothetical protein